MGETGTPMGYRTRKGIEEDVYPAHPVEEISPEDLPTEFSTRLYLRLDDFSRASVEALANRATLQLFRLVVESFSAVQLELPRRDSLNAIRDQLSAGQARLLGYIVRQ